MRNNFNILVVDDDEMILDIFEDFFATNQDYSVFTTRDGDEALEICRKNRIDFCFTDLNMPGMDGVEFVHKILGINSTIPVAVMTGYPSTERVIATLKNGVVDFLVKPFKMQEIGHTIQRALERRALFLENMYLKEEIRGREQLASLKQELSEKVEDLNTLSLVLQKVDEVRTSSDLYNLLVKLSADITGGDASYFHILDESLKRPVFVTSFHREGKRPGKDNVAYVEKILADKMLEGIPFYMKDTSNRGPSNNGIRSMIATPLKIREKVFGMVSVITQAGSEPFTEMHLYYLNFMARRSASVIENIALYENIYENLFATLYAFVEAIEAKDPYTKQHSSRVAEFALSIGKEMACPHEQLDLLNFSGHLHDIGKIGIRDSILQKPGSLTPEEYEVIKKHPVIGANIIGHLGLMSEEQRVIRHHHERWDGKGYPDGLKGEAIPFLSRILAVADVYDAMASHRAYRKKIPDGLIIDTIRENAGMQFDKEVVNGFLKVHERGEISVKVDLVTSDAVQPSISSESRMFDELLHVNMNRFNL